MYAWIFGWERFPEDRQDGFPQQMTEIIFSELISFTNSWRMAKPFLTNDPNMIAPWREISIPSPSYWTHILFTRGSTHIFLFQRLRCPDEPTPPDPVLRRHALPWLPPHELCGELRLHLHLVGQAAEDWQPVQQAHAETGRHQEGTVDPLNPVFRRPWSDTHGTRFSAGLNLHFVTSLLEVFTPFKNTWTRTFHTPVNPSREFFSKSWCLGLGF